MDLGHLIKHPELLDKDTLYDLRSLVALYPYYQTARLLMLQNLYILHSPSFDEELRKAAVYLTDRKVIFKLVEAAHYKLRNPESTTQKKYHTGNDENRTISLIDQFLDTIPEEENEAANAAPKRKPTPADAAVDYVSFLLETESEKEKKAEQREPQMKGQDLIDNFINNEGGKIELTDAPDSPPQIPDSNKTEEKEGDEGVFTETLARIYIKQGQYSKALEIIKRLNLNYPKKNVYFADQIRFLEKLIINNKYK